MGMGDGASVLLACLTYADRDGEVHRNFHVSRLRLGVDGGIGSAQALFFGNGSFVGGVGARNGVGTPLWTQNTLFLPFDGSGQYTDNFWGAHHFYNVDQNKNFSVVAGAGSARIVSLDTLFYGGAPDLFTPRTLAGVASCAVGGEAPDRSLACGVGAEAKGSWSMVEIVSAGCQPSRECKGADTLFVYARDANTEKANFGFRFPRHQVLGKNSPAVDWGDLARLGVFQGSPLNSPSVAWTHAGAPVALSYSNAPGEWILAPQAGLVGVDTLRFTLSLAGASDYADRFVHVVDSADLALLPASGEPGDTLWSARAGKLYELPTVDEAGARITYDIPQGEATLYENWLLAADAASARVRYTHLGEIHERSFVLMQESAEEFYAPSSSSAEEPSSSSEEISSSSEEVSSSSSAGGGKQLVPVWAAPARTGHLAPAAHFDLRGNRMGGKPAIPGIYLVREGSQTRKIVVR
jgi:hypothetical protein